MIELLKDRVVIVLSGILIVTAIIISGYLKYKLNSANSTIVELSKNIEQLKKDTAILDLQKEQCKNYIVEQNKAIDAIASDYLNKEIVFNKWKQQC